MAYPVEEFAVWLDTQLSDGIQVYDHAPDVGKLPAVICAPGDPVWGLITMAGPEPTFAWGVACQIVVSRSQPKYGTRAIVDISMAIQAAALAYEFPVEVISLEDIDTGEVFGEEALAGTMPMIITRKEGT